MEKHFDFANDSDVPRTEEDWNQVWNSAMENAVKHVRAMQVDSDDLRIPRQLTLVQLFTIAINGLIYHDWTEKDIQERVSKHDFQKIIARQAQDKDEENQ